MPNTTHGLFCRQTVLPHLGEDPDGYQKMLGALMEGLDPRTLMERQYLELWADASWKLRRLSRWEAQLWETDAPDEDALLAKLERLSRLQTTLRRQLDKAVRMLGGADVPTLYAQRARRSILADRGWTEVDCHSDREIARRVEGEVLAALAYGDSLAGLDKTLLDSKAAAAPVEMQNSQNELAPAIEETENCQNEPLPATPEEVDEDGAEDPGTILLSHRERILAHTRQTGDNPFRPPDLPRSPYALKM